MKVDTGLNRRRRKYSLLEQFKRSAWAIARPLFRFSPRLLFGWRNSLLRLFGARIGKEVRISSSAQITFPWHLEVGDWSSMGDRVIVYNLGATRIGQHVTVSQGAHLCAGSHDYSDPAFRLLKLPIEIDDQAWICADAFVGPGVTVGEGAVVGARAVVTKNVNPWDIVAGNPSKVIGHRDIRVDP